MTDQAAADSAAQNAAGQQGANAAQGDNAAQGGAQNANGAQQQDAHGAAAKTIASSGAAAGAANGAAAADGGQGDSQQQQQADAGKQYWPDDWREKAAEHASAGDKKAYTRELNRLKRITDPAALYGNYRELESKFDKGGLVRVPGEGATEQDVADFRKALGVPEKPEGYLESVKFANGATLGDADKPLATAFAQALHEVNAPPAVYNAALNWYYAQQEAAAAQVDEADETFRQEADRALKDEWGAAYKRNINAVSSIFASAPGGTDLKNPNALMNRILGGRTAEGRLIGNDPEVIKFLVSMAREVNPEATVVDMASPGGKGVDDQIADIEKLMRTDRRAYNKDEKTQARYRELLSAREKIQTRKRA